MELLMLQPHLSVLAQHLGCSWQLLAGQAMQESAGDPSAIGDDGLAYGLWQMHQATLDNCRVALPDMADWTLENLLDPENAFTAYMVEMLRLQKWLSHYGLSDVKWLLAAWVWGCGRLELWLNAEIVRANLDGDQPGYEATWELLPDVVHEYVRKCQEYVEGLCVE